MERAIVGYHRDEANDWVAELDCHHNQHVRNNPPFVNRPWVESAEGRTERLGTKLRCARCDRLELPEHLTPHKKTPEFTESTLPKGLLSEHSTKKGVWGRIAVREGQLNYTVTEPESVTHAITEGQSANIAPEMIHFVAPIGRVRFEIEFYSNNAMDKKG